MFKISAETFTKSYVYNIIDKEKKLWLTNKDLGVQNIYDLVDKESKGRYETKNPTKQQIRKYKRHRSKLIDGKKFVYTHDDIMIMSCRVSTPEAIECRSKLGFKRNEVMLSIEQSVISKTTKLFSNEKILLQHSALGYRIDLYFPKHKLAIEVDKKGHTDRDKRKENEREKKNKGKT